MEATFRLREAWLWKQGLARPGSRRWSVSNGLVRRLPASVGSSAYSPMESAPLAIGCNCSLPRVGWYQTWQAYITPARLNSLSTITIQIMLMRIPIGPLLILEDGLNPRIGSALPASFSSISPMGFMNNFVKFPLYE